MSLLLQQQGNWPPVISVSTPWKFKIGENGSDRKILPHVDVVDKDGDVLTNIE